MREETIESHRCVVERVVSVMRQRLNRNFSLAEMATVAGVSPFHFSRIFRQVTGVSPGRFHAALRLEAAERLLVTTRLSVTEICFEVGYSSLGTFVRRFTDEKGLSPRQLRRSAGSATDALSSLFPLPARGVRQQTRAQRRTE